MQKKKGPHMTSQCPASERQRAARAAAAAAAAPVASGLTNTEALGQVLYTKYIFFFQIAGLILLVAMIGAIVLTLRHKEGVKRQNIADQNARSPATAIEIIKVKPGQGI